MQPPHILKVALYADVIKRDTHTDFSTENIDYSVGLKISECICQKLKCVLEIVSPSDGQVGVPLGGGNWSGIIGMVHRGEADLGVGGIGVTEPRMEDVDFSYPYSVEDVGFVAQRPTFSFIWKTALRIFPSTVWCGLAALHVLMPLLFFARFRGRHSFSKIALHTFGTVLGQQSPKRLQTSSLVLLWTVAMMVMGMAYKAQLLSVLTMPTSTGVLHAAELSAEIEKGRYDSTTYRGTFYVEAMLRSQDRSLRVIGANLYKNEGTADMEKFLENEGTVKTAFIGSKQNLLYLKNKYFISADVFFSELIAVVIRRDFCCKEEINEMIHEMNAAGLYGKYFKEEIFKKMVSNITNFFPNEEEAVSSLSFLHLRSVFFLLIVGYVLAFLCLLAELIVYKYYVFEKMKRFFK